MGNVAAGGRGDLRGAIHLGDWQGGFKAERLGDMGAAIVEVQREPPPRSPGQDRPAQRETWRRIASANASHRIPAAPNVPRPPAALTAATSSGVVGPPAIPASSIGYRMPSNAQSGVENDHVMVAETTGESESRCPGKAGDRRPVLARPGAEDRVGGLLRAAGHGERPQLGGHLGSATK